jgi:hypothetical protein
MDKKDNQSDLEILDLILGVSEQIQIICMQSYGSRGTRKGEVNYSKKEWNKAYSQYNQDPFIYCITLAYFLYTGNKLQERLYADYDAKICW